MPQGGAHDTHEDVAIEQRREQVASMYLARLSMRQIGEELGVDKSTVCRDLKAVREKWEERSVEALDKHLAEQLAAIDKLEYEAWDAWERSKQIRTKDRVKRAGIEIDGAPSTSMEQVEEWHEEQEYVGDPQYLARVQSCIEERSKLLGLYAPEKREVSGPNGGAIQHEHSRAELNDLLTEANTPEERRAILRRIAGLDAE